MLGVPEWTSNKMRLFEVLCLFSVWFSWSESWFWAEIHLATSFPPLLSLPLKNAEVALCNNSLTFESHSNKNWPLFEKRLLLNLEAALAHYCSVWCNSEIESCRDPGPKRFPAIELEVPENDLVVPLLNSPYFHRRFYIWRICAPQIGSLSSLAVGELLWNSSLCFQAFG